MIALSPDLCLVPHPVVSAMRRAGYTVEDRPHIPSIVVQRALLHAYTHHVEPSAPYPRRYVVSLAAFPRHHDADPIRMLLAVLTACHALATEDGDDVIYGVIYDRQRFVLLREDIFLQDESNMEIWIPAFRACV